MALQDTNLGFDELVKVLNNKLDKGLFDKLFEETKENHPNPADATVSELAFYLYLADDGILIYENAGADWQASDVEAHVTSKIVDPVMLQLKCFIDGNVRLSYQRY